MTRYARKKLFIVYRRSLSVLIPIARYANEDKARERARRENLFVAYIPHLAPDTREALGIRSA